MGLSRLDNFLNSPRGTVFYVDANALDATDSSENKGTSQTRPFRSIQRALAEVARYSYQRGNDNDRFSKSTVLVAPGTYFIDNRPGAVVQDNGNLILRSGATTVINEWDLISNFNVFVSDNDLYKLNSVHGGVFLPRGCSIIGMDLRKVKIIPLYVPDPENADIERSSVFRLTGGCFVYGFTIFDSDPNGNCYKNYTRNLYVPNFSHHKLSGFEYADGKNKVVIQDEFFETPLETSRTDLDMYYDKIARVYGDSTGRPVDDATYTGGITIDIEPSIDEYRIVGSKGREVGITSIRAGDGDISPSTTITVSLAESVEELAVDSPIEISGITVGGYDGQYVVFKILSPTQVQYRTQNIPDNPLPSTSGGVLSIVVDSVTSASPYIYNVSLRSVYGLCGLHADGDKSDGFKSMVVAQYTGIGLQKDNKAFVKYNDVTGDYDDYESVPNLHTNSRSRFSPDYENFHIKASNNAFLQLVSVFAIGYAQHFIAESGGDFSITNSNSNFGAKALVSSGFRKDAFEKDDVGYITHIIPPQEIESDAISIEFLSIDVGLTTSISAGAATTTRLYLYEQDNIDDKPSNVFDGYRIGAKINEVLKIQTIENGVKTEYSSNVVMPGTSSSHEKSYNVSGISTSGNIVTFSSSHLLESGESIRIISDNGRLPDGLEHNKIYYAIRLNSTQIKISQTLDKALLGESTSLNTKGGNLKVVSRVSDKNSGDIGHPVQWDSRPNALNWYINVSSSDNTLYTKILNSGVSLLGRTTSRSYVTRITDTRNVFDTLYRFRYVIPKDSPIGARPPLDGYIIQQSSSSNSITEADIQNYFSNSLVNFTDSTRIRNPRFITNITWSLKYATVTTELPHDLTVGSEVEILNVLPVKYTGRYIVTEIVNSRQFKYFIAASPGVFSSSTTVRNSKLPYFRRLRTSKTYQVYKSQEVRPYIQGEQDGVYYLTVINCSNSPTVSPFTNLNYSQPIENLYPQLDRDNPISDPNPSSSFALPSPIGQVSINDPQYSLTKETVEFNLKDFGGVSGLGITSILSNSTGTAHTIFSQIDHGFSGITSVSILNAGSNYLVGTYYAANVVGFAGSVVGKNASVKIVVGGATTIATTGTIISVEIMSGGSAYGIGNTLSVIPSAGIGTTTGFSAGIIRVESVTDDIGDVISISGVGGTFTGYNTLYRITGISSDNQITVSSASAVAGYSTVSLGSTALSKSYYIRTGKSLSITSFVYSSTTGIATVGFSTSHGLFVNNKIRLGGFDDNYFNKDVTVKRLISLTSANVFVGESGQGLPTTGTRYAYLNGYTSASGLITPENENSGRIVRSYAGVTTCINDILSDVAIGNDNKLIISNAFKLGLRLGDYLQVDNEIMRIKQTVSDNTIYVFRGLFGTRREVHVTGSVVRKIKVYPIEFHRNSIIRASGHTFEYLGYGPGNYSTALPEKQDRIISSREEIISQSSKESGGAVIFNAMNSDGEFYTGNKKLNSSTGEEESFDIPLQTIRGEEISSGDDSKGVSVSSIEEALVSRSLKVEGGSKNDLISKFNGPVIFNNKITSYSKQGIEASSLYLQGNEEISRRFSINYDKPIIAGNYGDIEFNSQPIKNGYAGWIYTTDNEWQPWGYVGINAIGVTTDTVTVGFSSVIDFRSKGGIIITRQYNSSVGITTLVFDGNPRIAISTGVQNSLVGLVTQINFIGSGVTILGSTNAGIVTVNLGFAVGVGSTFPGKPFNSLQFNDGGRFGGVPVSTYDNADGKSKVVFGDIDTYNSGSGNLTNCVIFDKTGYVGFSSAIPTSKIEIVADNERSLYIKSTASAVEIVKIQNTTNDTTPFIIDQNGNVGINTDSTIASLDVVGNVAISGQLRVYKSNRQNYIGFAVSSGISSNYSYTLPTSYGVSNQVLATDGNGLLFWKNDADTDTNTGNVVIAGTGITISYSGNNATINNSGVRRIVAGIGVTISPSNGTGEVTITATNQQPVSQSFYPFTTRGFSIPI